MMPGTARPEQATDLRRLFDDAGYRPVTAAARLELDHLPNIPGLVGKPIPDDLGTDGLATLLRLFLFGRSVEHRQFERSLEPEARGLLEEAGLVTARAGGLGGVAPAMLLVPVEDVWIASDLATDPDSGEGVDLADDAVYPALTLSGRRFLAGFPRTPCERLLDLCGGSGVGAIVGAGSATEAWTADLTERSTAFARFNAWLNGRENVHVVRGDLWEPVEGLTFDRIIAHPPYVPVAANERIFRDGGPDGERVTARILEGLPRFLEPGGTFHTTCVVSDRGEATAEERIRELLGDASDSFEVVVGEITSVSPTAHFLKLIEAGRIGFEEAGAEARRLHGLGVTRMISATLLLRRTRGEGTPPVTARRAAGHIPSVEGMEILRRWARGSALPDLEDRILASRPKPHPELRLVLAYRPEEGEWTPTGDARLASGRPLPASLEVAADVAHFIARCDGVRTAAEHLADLRAAGVVAEGIPDAPFLRTLWHFYGEGVLDLEG